MIIHVGTDKNEAVLKPDHDDSIVVAIKEEWKGSHFLGFRLSEVSGSKSLVLTVDSNGDIIIGTK
jgi:hypothetical protein